jgi:hypothetical protein
MEKKRIVVLAGLTTIDAWFAGLEYFGQSGSGQWSDSRPCSNWYIAPGHKKGTNHHNPLVLNYIAYYIVYTYIVHTYIA